MGPMFGAIWRYIVAALAAGAVAALVLAQASSLRAATGISGALSRIVLDSVGFIGLYIGAVTLLHGSAAPLRRVIKLMRELRSRKAMRATVSA